MSELYDILYIECLRIKTYKCLRIKTLISVLEFYKTLVSIL